MFRVLVVAAVAAIGATSVDTHAGQCYFVYTPARFGSIGEKRPRPPLAKNPPSKTPRPHELRHQCPLTCRLVKRPSRRPVGASSANPAGGEGREKVFRPYVKSNRVHFVTGKPKKNIYRVKKNLSSAKKYRPGYFVVKMILCAHVFHTRFAPDPSIYSKPTRSDL